VKKTTAGGARTIHDTKGELREGLENFDLLRFKD